MLAGKGVDVKKIPGLILPNGRVDTSKLTNAMFADKTGESKATIRGNDIANQYLILKMLLRQKI